VKNKLDFIMAGGAVQRFHTMRTIHPQNVAEHSFGVAWLVYLLTGGKPSAALLLAALGHDLAEHVTGDLPAPAKRALGLGPQFAAAEDAAASAAGLLLPPLTDDEAKVLKLADTLELVLYCQRELAMGNSRMREIALRGIEYAHELRPLTPNQELIFHIAKEGV